LSTSFGCARRSWSIFICRRSSKREALPRAFTMSPLSKSLAMRGFSGLPHAAFELAGLVAQDQVQVGLVGLGGALLFGQNQKETVEELAFVESGQIGDIDVFHNRCQ